MSIPGRPGDGAALLPERLTARLAAILYAGVAGVALLLYAALPVLSAATRVREGVFGAACVAIGLVLWYLPWQRWSSRALLALIPLSCAIIALLNLVVPINPYRYELYLFPLFAWIGLAFRRGTAIAALPLLVPTYVLPLAVQGRLSTDAVQALLYVAAFCALQGEGMAWLVARLNRAQAALRDGEVRFRTLVEEAPIGIMIIDGEGVLEAVNPALCAISGYPEDDLVGRRFTALLPPDQAAALARRFAERFARGVRVDDEYEVPAKDGRRLTLLSAATFLTNLAGQPRRAAFIVDITERKRAEQERERLLAQEHAARQRAEHAETRLRAIVEASPLPIVTMDLAGRVQSWNGAAARTFGWLEAEILGMPLPVVPAEERAAFAATLARVARGEVLPTLEVRRLRKDGSAIDLQISTAPLHDTDGRIAGIMAVNVDITARKQMERLRSDFVTSVSHELRTPLTAIVGFADLLQARWALMPDAKRREQLDRIALAARRQQRLVEDLLLLSQLEDGPLTAQVRPILLASLLERAAMELQGSYAGQRIDLDGPRDLEAVADPDRLLQIVTNLLDNAAKYSPEGAPIGVSWCADDRMAAIRVRDYGPGVTAEGRERLFTRFGRVPGSPIRAGRVGTGLGLFLGRQLAQLMDGDLDLEATGTDGSVFRLRLPAHVAEPVAQAAAS